MQNNVNLLIRYAEKSDETFWFSLDKHISIAEWKKKIRDKQGYVLCVNNKPIGILRYNLFWDNTPFCTMLYIDCAYQKKGYGKELMSFWENEMRAQKYGLALVSTQADEGAQHFYRKIGYVDCGSLNIANQTPELFLQKVL